MDLSNLESSFPGIKDLSWSAENNYCGGEENARKWKSSAIVEVLMSLPATSWTILVPEKLACDVYIGAMPLRVPAAAPKALPAVLAHLGVQHFYTLVQHPSDETCIYYDFLPADPESPLTMASVLSGQSVKGIIQERKLRMPPRRRCWRVGKTKGGSGLESAQNFNTQWDSRLSLFHNCRHYSNDLVQHLTGEKDITSRLDMLRSRTGLQTSEASTSSDEDWAMIDAITVSNGKGFEDHSLVRKLAQFEEYARKHKPSLEIPSVECTQLNKNQKQGNEDTFTVSSPSSTKDDDANGGNHSSGE